MTLRSTLLSIASLAVAVVACGGSEGPASLSVAEEKTLSGLSDEEASETCFELGAYVDKTLDADEKKRLGCLASAVFASLGATNEDAAKASCRKAVDECMQNGGGFPVGFTGSCKTFRERAKACQKTVGDYALCMEDKVADYETKLVDPCADIRIGNEPAPPAAPGRCAAIAEACPTMLTTGPTP